jgi:membrane-associated protease RseP (regulator of RpoE activity)
MYRVLFSFLLEGFFAGCGLALFFWIGRYRVSWHMLVGFIAAIMLVTIIRLIPVLSAESTIQRILRKSGGDREKLEAMMGRKKQPLISVGAITLFVFLCILGFVVRLTR